MALNLLIHSNAINSAKHIYFYPTFQLSPTVSHCKYKLNHSENQSILISLLHILDKSFVSSIITHLSYNLSKYMQYKDVWKLFEVGYLHQHTAITFYHLDWNGKLVKFVRILNNRVFYADTKRNRWIKNVFNNSCHKLKPWRTSKSTWLQVL